MSAPVAWVVGCGGLLGRALTRCVAATAQPYHPPIAFSWDAPERLAGELRHAVEEFVAIRPDGHHVVFWSAGAGVVGATEAQLARECRALELFLGLYTPRHPATVFLASSAGGVWGGAPPPACETTSPAPRSAYGRSKLAQERLLREWAAAAPGRVAVIGRIANLFGGGQNMHKPQGLISQALRALVYDRPLHLYVSLDSVRDFLFVDDCAAAIAELVLGEHAASPHTDGIRILASEQEMTLGSALAVCARIAHRPLRLVRAGSAQATLQPSVLRFRSLHAAPPMQTSFVDAVHRTFVALQAQHRRGDLTAPALPLAS